MLFNSLDFAIFLPIVFCCYWFLFNKKLRNQNLFVVIASYTFYCWWDWRFLSLIVISTFADFFLAKTIAKTSNQKKRKGLLWLSLLINLGILGFFKYYDFFLENFVEAFSVLGFEMTSNSLNIILPVGISFYTFQTLSYTIDVYRRKLEPTRDIVSFAAFVSFFPQLVAGPIERAINLLPQFDKPRRFDRALAVDGMRQILWGGFKKVVIADNCAYFVDVFFNNPGEYNGSTLALGALFFAFQIYGDFSGYSDIAIGTSRLFGFNLQKNFAYPYFSRDIAEFWRRWHISLSTWFRDYLYIPLGGSKVSKILKLRNTLIIFVVSGFWHGANWTFIIWGLLNALYFLPLLLLNKNRTYIDVVANNRSLPTIREVVSISVTFFLTTIAWIFFRAEGLTEAISYLNGTFNASLFQVPDFVGKTKALITLAGIIVMLLVEWINRTQAHGLSVVSRVQSPVFRNVIYAMIVLFIMVFGNFGENQFIYFQF